MDLNLQRGDSIAHLSNVASVRDGNPQGPRGLDFHRDPLWLFASNVARSRGDRGDMCSLCGHSLPETGNMDASSEFRGVLCCDFETEGIAPQTSPLVHDIETLETRELDGFLLAYPLCQEMDMADRSPHTYVWAPSGRSSLNSDLDNLLRRMWHDIYECHSRGAPPPECLSFAAFLHMCSSRRITKLIPRVEVDRDAAPFILPHLRARCRTRWEFRGSFVLRNRRWRHLLPAARPRRPRFGFDAPLSSRIT